MSYSSGVFSINSTGQPVVTGTVISSTVFNAFTADIATGLSTCVLKDGTQTITANIPMSSFKLTGLSAGTASGNSIRYEQVNGVVTTAGDTLYATGAGALSRLAIGTARQQLATNSGATAPEWVASMQSLMTATGDTIEASAANTPARMPATASVAAHATTSDVWTARETILTGTAVTFTDIADADYVGQVAWVYQNATHTWTDGAVFDVQGGGNYTAAIGDWVRINAVTVSTFDVTVFPADATAIPATQAQQETATSTTTYVSPGRQQYHPSAAKAWVNFNGTGTIAIRGSYNVSSITDNGTGDYTVVFTTAMSDANFASVITTGEKTVSWAHVMFAPTANTPFATTGVRFTTNTAADVAEDTKYACCVCFGDQ